MIVHEAVSMTKPIVSLINMLECVQKIDAVLVALENGLSLVTPGGNMIYSASVFDAEGTGHGKRISKQKRKVKH